jgi:hypothetical protein
MNNGKDVYWSPLSSSSSSLSRRSRVSPDVCEGFRDLALSCATELRDARRQIGVLERRAKEAERGHRRDMIQSATRFREMRYEYDDILQQEMSEIEQSRVQQNQDAIRDGSLNRTAYRRIQDRQRRQFEKKISELSQMRKFYSP